MDINTDIPAFFLLREWIEVMLRRIGTVDENEMHTSVYLWATMRTEECASNLYTYILWMTKNELIIEMGY